MTNTNTNTNTNADPFDGTGMTHGRHVDLSGSTGARPPIGSPVRTIADELTGNTPPRPGIVRRYGYLAASAVTLVAWVLWYRHGHPSTSIFGHSFTVDGMNRLGHILEYALGLATVGLFTLGVRRHALSGRRNR